MSSVVYEKAGGPEAGGSNRANAAACASHPIAVPATSVHRAEADGISVFYRSAGHVDAPVVLLLHGFPSSSFMFRELIPRLADRCRVIAPDLPGFGFTEVPQDRFPEDVGIARFGKPEEIAGLIAFMLSPAAKWMTGASIRMDGGEVKGI